jgi:ABC-type glycerol-3-phosphate transport system substrate-binding protein
MRGIEVQRRRFLQASAATFVAPMIAHAQSKPDKLVFVGDNGPWHWCLVEEVAPAFEKATGIKIDFTLLPIDALNARLKAELNSGSSGIDIVQWTSQQIGWLSPHLEDHAKLLSEHGHADFDWDDFVPALREMASWNDKLLGIPYRVTMGVLHYQKALLEEAGFARPPGTFAELRAAAIATTKVGPLDRYGLGYLGRQGPAIVDSFCPFLRSNGGDFYNPKTWEVLINRPEAVEALEFFGDLMTKDKVVVPASITWEFDEIVAGGQNDRYAMAVTLTPYGSLINDPTKSKTGGRWAWAPMPGGKTPADSRTFFGGWSLAVAKGSKQQLWAFEFIQLACSKLWMQRSMLRGNAPPRVSVLNDPAMAAKFGWAPVAAAAFPTALLDPRDAMWATLELQLRAGISEVLLGQKTAKVALDGVASDWQRSLRRAGIR